MFGLELLFLTRVLLGMVLVSPPLSFLVICIVPSLGAYVAAFVSDTCVCILVFEVCATCDSCAIKGPPTRCLLVDILNNPQFRSKKQSKELRGEIIKCPDGRPATRTGDPRLRRIFARGTLRQKLPKPNRAILAIWQNTFRSLKSNFF